MSDNNKQELKRFKSFDIEDIIESQDKLMRDNLKQIEQDFKRQLQTSIDTAKSMEMLALKECRMREAKRYQVMAQIYQQLLDNYTLSNSYNKP